MNIKTKFLWATRVITYGLRYFLYEYPRGLDFSKRQRDTKTLNESTGYALTSKSALKNFLDISGNEERISFIDVGGGKGGTAFFASQFGFKNSTSLEFEASLHNIAKSNIEILGIRDKVELINQDAFEYTQYYKHSHIFMFRPLNGEQMKELLLLILNNLKISPSEKVQTYVFLLYGDIEKKHIDEVFGSRNNIEILIDDMCPFRNTNRRVIKIFHV